MKCDRVRSVCATRRSLPVRGAWVEMLQSNIKSIRKEVAPRAGSVG